MSARPLTRSLHARRSRAWLISLAVVALVWVQALGALHAVVHAPWTAPRSGVASLSVAPASAVNAAAPSEFSHLLSALFAGHDRDHDCQIYDQLAHADLATLPQVALPTEPPQQLHHDQAPDSWLAVRLRAFRARDPPSLA